MRRILGALMLFGCVTTPLLGHASDMDRVVRSMETQLGVRHTHIPMLGFAMFVGKVATGFQMPGIKLAVFENVNLSEQDPHAVQRVVANALGPEWAPFVISTSNHGAKQNWIYLREQGKTTHLFIATAEGNEVSLVEVKASERQMRRYIKDTDTRGRNEK
ncbi:MAG TPA: hypothetical protein VG498_18185 [Terriglobales bacterium]|nr:hypothetical protein [Terriglobales bacterium]